MRPAIEILLADADVLIDYRNSDLSIFTLVSKHIGPVGVLREILNEAPESACEPALTGLTFRHHARSDTNRSAGLRWEAYYSRDAYHRRLRPQAAG